MLRPLLILEFEVEWKPANLSDIAPEDIFVIWYDDELMDHLLMTEQDSNHVPIYFDSYFSSYIYHYTVIEY